LRRENAVEEADKGFVIGLLVFDDLVANDYSNANRKLRRAHVAVHYLCVSSFLGRAVSVNKFIMAKLKEFALNKIYIKDQGTVSM
jgi:hypothetical protein